MKVKVPLWRTSPTQAVTIDPAATVGAQIGVNLLLPDGSVAQMADFGAAPADGGTLTTTDDLDEGQWNLWFTDKRAQDAVGGILADSANVTLRYAGGTSITADLTDAGNTGTGTLQAITVDAKGRVTGYRPAAYIHPQPTPASVWTINHNLGFKPSVSLRTAGDAVFDAEVSHPSINTAVVTLSQPLSGSARCV